MTDCSCTNFPASLGNVTFGASVGIGTTSPQYSLDVERPTGGPLANLRRSIDQPGMGATINPYGAAAVVYGAGAEYDGTTSMARAASATPFEQLNDSFHWYGDTNLTSGNPYPRTLRMTLDGAGQVGIGTSAPQTQLHIAGTAAPDSQVTAQSLEIETSGYGDNNLTFARYSDTSWSKTRLWLLHARGTKASPAALQDGDWLGTIGFGGWTSAGWADGVNISATVDGTPTGTVTPGKLVLSTIDSGGTGHDLVLLANGNVGIGTDSPQQALDVAGTVRCTGILLGGNVVLPVPGLGLLSSDSTRTNVDAGGCYYAN